MKLSRIFKYLHRLTLKLVAISILVTAVVVTMARLALPEISNYRGEVAKWLGAYMGQPVAISNIQANWDGWLPELELRQLQILDRNFDEVALDFDSVFISIDLIKSLRTGRIVPWSVTVSDLSLELIRRKDGSVVFNEHQFHTIPDASATDHSVFIRWVLERKHLFVENVQITLHDHYKTDRTFRLPNVTLRIKHDSPRTQIEGDISLPQPYGDRLKFALDVHGDMLTRDWYGEIYLEATHINAALLLAETEAMDGEIRMGDVDLKLWGMWDQAKLHRLDGEVSLQGLQWFNNQTRFDRAAGRFTTTLAPDNGFDLMLSIDEMETTHGTWPLSEVVVRKIYHPERDGYRYHMQADHLKLADMEPVLNSLVKHVDELKMLADMNLTGILSNSIIKYDPALPFSEGFYIASDFSAINGRIPDASFEVQGLSGFMQGVPERGTIEINTSMATFKADKLLTQPLTLYELRTNFAWWSKDDQLLIESPFLQAHTEDFDLQTRGRLKFVEDREFPLISLLFKLSNGSVDRVTKYLPATTPVGVVRWFDRALVSGEVVSAMFAFRGYPDDFPFDNKQGVLQGHIVLKQTNINYNPAWPAIDGVDAEIMFDQQTLVMHANAGNLLGATISQAQMSIANYLSGTTDRILAIDGRISGTVDDALQIIKASPLHTIQSLKTVALHDGVGNLLLDLTLRIPFADDKPNIVDGVLHLDQVTMYFTEDMIFSDFDGRVQFTRNAITAEALNAKYFDHPVKLTLARRRDAPMMVKLSGEADGQFIARELARYVPALTPRQAEITERMSGSCRWELVVDDLSFDRLISSEWALTSSLNGLAIDLPAPLSKSFEPVPIELKISAPSERHRRIAIDYAGDNTVSMDYQDGQLAVSGQVERFAMLGWLELLAAGITTDQLMEGETLLSVMLEANTLLLANYQFPSTRLSFKNRRLHLDGADVNGEIYFKRTAADRRELKINLGKLVLAEPTYEIEEVTASSISIVPATIPSLDIDITDLNYHAIPMGRMILRTSNIEQGLSVDQLRFIKPGLESTGTGRWRIVDGAHRSEVSLMLDAASMQNMLETFHYDVAAIQDAKTRLVLNAGWEGTPADFSLDKLNGTLDIDLGQGRFTDIETSAGRFFGLLSLQTLPRRLSLDFSDLFGKGLAFDKIEGTFQIDEGSAYTNNLNMTGPAAHISILGRTGLLAQDYDQIATVTPKIADSLPLAGGVFGPVGIGVGAAIFFTGKLFRSLPDSIDSLLQAQYAIRGTWDEPEVIKIKQRETSQTELP